MDQFGVQKPELKTIARTPELPVPGVKKREESSRDPRIVLWQGAKIKNIIGLDEVSAAGLFDEIGVKLVEVPAGSRAAKAGLREGDVNFQAHASSVKAMNLSYDREQKAILNWRYSKGGGLTVA